MLLIITKIETVDRYQHAVGRSPHKLRLRSSTKAVILQGIFGKVTRTVAYPELLIDIE